VRTHPETGVRHKSVLKPINGVYTNKTVDFHSREVTDISIKPCVDGDIENTVAVMGGEDWKMWMTALKEANLLAPKAKSIAYSYIGPEVTQAVYRDGTIGRAKDHLEATAFEITDMLKEVEGEAFVSVNKALVTQASSAIPVIPLYISLLYRVMKNNNVHEGCIEQIQRLFQDKVYTDKPIETDEKGRIRVDELELRADIQAEVSELWKTVSTETLPEISDIDGYSMDFFNLFGFKVAGVNYEEEANEMVNVPSL